MKIELCSTEQISKFPKGLARFQRLINLDEMLVTDHSTVGDFDQGRQAYRDLTTACGYIVGRDSLVWKVCRDLQK